MDSSKKQRLGLLSLGAAAAITLGFSIDRAVENVSDSFYEIPEEVRVERDIGRPIYFDSGDPTERKSRLEGFAINFYEARYNWDNFEQQFGLVRRIYLRSFEGEIAGEMNRWGELRLDNVMSNGSTLVHELAHAWHHRRTDSAFEGRWRAITNNHYVEDFSSASQEDVVANGAISRYALKNFEEDVAETARFVYELNNSRTVLPGFSNKVDYDWRDLLKHKAPLLTPESIPRVIEKIKLLQEYDFFSEQERDRALELMNGS